MGVLEEKPNLFKTVIFVKFVFFFFSPKKQFFLWPHWGSKGMF